MRYKFLLSIYHSCLNVMSSERAGPFSLRKLLYVKDLSSDELNNVLSAYLDLISETKPLKLPSIFDT